MDKRYCKHCGAEIPEGSRFCTKCGTPVDEDDTEETGFVEEPQSDHRNTIIFVMAVVIIGLVACFGTFLLLSSRNNRQSTAVADTSVTETEKPKETEQTEKKEGALPGTTAKSVVKHTPKPTPTPEEEEEDDDEDDEDDYYDDDYLLPDSSTRKLTTADLAGMSAQELTYARNEIYARHGKVFQHNELNRYFQTKSWYHADPSFQDTMTSALEQSNAVFILQYQKNNGLTYEPGN